MSRKKKPNNSEDEKKMPSYILISIIISFVATVAILILSQFRDYMSFFQPESIISASAPLSATISMVSILIAFTGVLLSGLINAKKGSKVVCEILNYNAHELPSTLKLSIISMLLVLGFSVLLFFSDSMTKIMSIVIFGFWIWAIICSLLLVFRVISLCIDLLLKVSDGKAPDITQHSTAEQRKEKDKNLEENESWNNEHPS